MQNNTVAVAPEALKSTQYPGATKKQTPKSFFPIWGGVLGLVMLLVLVGAILQVLTPPTPSVPQTEFVTQNFNESKTVFKGIKYTGEEITVPKDFSAAVKKGTHYNEEEFIAQIVSKYKLVQNQEYKILWSKPPYSLNQDRFNKFYLFAHSHPAPTEFRPIDIDIAISAAEVFIKEFFPQLPIQVLKDRISYHKVGYDPVSATKEQANLVEIPFAQTIDGFPVYHENKPFLPFIVRVDSQDIVRSVQFSPEFSNIEITQKLPSITIDQAIKNIEAGKAAIISAGYENERLSLEEITSADLKTVVIEYRVDPDSDLVYPFFRFTGTARNSVDDTLEIELITPAVVTRSSR